MPEAGPIRPQDLRAGRRESGRGTTDYAAKAFPLSAAVTLVRDPASGRRARGRDPIAGQCRDDYFVAKAAWRMTE